MTLDDFYDQIEDAFKDWVNKMPTAVAPKDEELEEIIYTIVDDAHRAAYDEGYEQAETDQEPSPPPWVDD